MSAPVAFRRLYRDNTGPEYQATPDLIGVAIKSVMDHARGPDPFRLHVRLDNGQSIWIKPKGIAA